MMSRLFSSLSVFCFLIFYSSVCKSTCHAQQHTRPAPEILERATQDMAAAKRGRFRHELRASDFTAFPSTLNQGRDRLGNYAGRTTDAAYTLTMPLPTGFALQFGVGGAWHRLFAPSAAKLPSDLFAANMLFGVLFQPSKEWRFLLQVRPGFYSDFRDISFRDFNAPVLLGAEYQMNEKFKWIFGLSYDAYREFPVVPGIGFHWRFADKWTLELIAPKPRLVYNINDKYNAYLFGEYRGGSFRVADDFGSIRANRRLNGEWLNLREFNVGVGGEMSIMRGVSAFAEAGATVARLWLYEDARLQYASEPGAIFRAGFRISF